METLNAPLQRMMLLTMFAAVLASATACRKGEESTSLFPLEGKVEKIVLNSDGTGKISVSYTDKNQQPMTGTGEVTHETEIMINGAVAALKDIRDGERVRGEVRVEKKGEVRKQIAVRIQVDRAQPVGSDK